MIGIFYCVGRLFVWIFGELYFLRIKEKRKPLPLSTLERGLRGEVKI